MISHLVVHVLEITSQLIHRIEVVAIEFSFSILS